MAVAFSYILLDLDIVGCSLWTWTLQTRIQHPEVDGLWRDIQAPKINDWKKNRVVGGYFIPTIYGL